MHYWHQVGPLKEIFDPALTGSANSKSALFRVIIASHKVKASAIWAGCEFCGKFARNSIR